MVSADANLIQVHGRITALDSDTPLAHATLRLVNETNLDSWFNVKADAQGQWETLLPEGHYTLSQSQETPAKHIIVNATGFHEPGSQTTDLSHTGVELQGLPYWSVNAGPGAPSKPERVTIMACGTILTWPTAWPTLQPSPSNPAQPRRQPVVRYRAGTDAL